VALSVFLALSVGVAFSLVWIFPAISFEIGVLIGAVSLSIMCYLFIKITHNMDSPAIDDNYIMDKIYDEIDLNNVILPRSKRSRRNRR
jgi:divalent metal cation (Fe/Co/Zn/Cd) transporter